MKLNSVRDVYKKDHITLKTLYKKMESFSKKFPDYYVIDAFVSISSEECSFIFTCVDKQGHSVRLAIPMKENKHG